VDHWQGADSGLYGRNRHLENPPNAGTDCHPDGLAHSLAHFLADAFADSLAHARTLVEPHARTDLFADACTLLGPHARAHTEPISPTHRAADIIAELQPDCCSVGCAVTKPDLVTKPGPYIRPVDRADDGAIVHALKHSDSAPYDSGAEQRADASALVLCGVQLFAAFVEPDFHSVKVADTAAVDPAHQRALVLADGPAHRCAIKDAHRAAESLPHLPAKSIPHLCSHANSDPHADADRWHHGPCVPRQSGG